jgi:hypothetical protein
MRVVNDDLVIEYDEMNRPIKPESSTEVMRGSGSYSERMKRYVTEEDAFLVYRSTGSRSLRGTAEILGLPLGTVNGWSRRHGWQQRSSDLDLEATEGIVQAMAVAIVGQQLKNVRVLAQIRDGAEEPRDQINAAKELNRIFERMADRMQLSGVLSVSDNDATEEEELEALVQTPEGVANVLERLRERTNRY